jgi:hypothetical protein
MRNSEQICTAEFDSELQTTLKYSLTLKIGVVYPTKQEQISPRLHEIKPQNQCNSMGSSNF